MAIKFLRRASLDYLYRRIWWLKLPTSTGLVTNGDTRQQDESDEKAEAEVIEFQIRHLQIRHNPQIKFRAAICIGLCRQQALPQIQYSP